MRALWLKFLDWLSHIFGIGRTAVPREPVMVRPIGVVRNNVKQPRMDGWGDVRSDILIREELTDALDGIEGYSHVIVIFAFDRVPESEQKLRLRPRGDERFPEHVIKILEEAAMPAFWRAGDAECLMGWPSTFPPASSIASSAPYSWSSPPGDITPEVTSAKAM